MKKILIIDEKIFSRICSAILELEGFITEIFDMSKNFLSLNKFDEFGLVIISYPFSQSLLAEIKKINIPTIILVDQVNKEVMNLLESLTTSYCMIKPIDYIKFKKLVKKIIVRKIPDTKSYKIL